MQQTLVGALVNVLV